MGKLVDVISSGLHSFYFIYRFEDLLADILHHKEISGHFFNVFLFRSG